MSKQEHVEWSEQQQDLQLQIQKDLEISQQKHEFLSIEEQIEAWEKLLGFFIEAKQRALCTCIMLMKENNIISKDEEHYLDDVISDDMNTTGRYKISWYLFPLENREARIDYMKNKIIELKKETK